MNLANPNGNLGTVWTNNQIAVTKDLVFGISLMTEQGWKPISWLPLYIADMVIRETTGNASFIWHDELAKARAEAATGI